MFRMTIVRLDDNPEFAEKMRLYNEQQRNVSMGRWAGSDQQAFAPAPFLESRALETTLKDDEFEIVKRALIEHWNATK